VASEDPARALTRFASCGGCAAKVAPAELQRIMARARDGATPSPADLLVGTETGDDAAVFRLQDDRALVLTTDFVTPVCDDPYLYGQVAAANALSDVFAMGGRPLVALAICAFPEALATEDAAAICRGGADKAAEAGAVVGGGHTVRNAELFYGLAVTGEVHPQRVVRNVGARPGDALVLTKPLGTGVFVNAYRSGKVDAAALASVLRVAATLNDRASRLMLEHQAHAATDVTGFGLAGHALGMARGSNVAFRLHTEAFPIHPGALALIDAGVKSRGATTNQETFHPHVAAAGAVAPARALVIYDPQTSGGLLVSLPSNRAPAFIEALKSAGMPAAAIVGEVVPVSTTSPPLTLL
jgi:selenide, water dikinase